MTAQAAIQRKVGERLLELQHRNPAFSIRAFSRRLGVSPATLSRLLSGKRRVSRDLAARIVDGLELGPADADAILSLFPVRERGTAAARGARTATRDTLELTMDHYQLVAEWQHFALRALLRTPEARRSPSRSRPEWLADRLGIPVSTARTALERLLRLGMVARTPGGALRATDETYSSPDGTPSVTVRRNHAQHLELARASLDRDPVEARDFTNLTIAISPARLPRARKAIRKFRRELERLLEDDSGEGRSEVYNLAIQLFPLTRVRQT
jgi:uncharacterized protein (TIGR02147 family)